MSIFQDVEGGEASPSPKPSARIEVVLERNQYEIRWPNIERVESVLKPELVMDWDTVESLTFDPAQTPLNAEIAPSLTGAPNLAQISAIDLEKALFDEHQPIGSTAYTRPWLTTKPCRYGCLGAVREPKRIGSDFEF